MPIPRELFISHASPDKAILKKLVLVFERHGIPHWYSRRSLIGAQQWHDEIGAALKRCDWFLLVLSPSAVKSEWVKRELVYALNDQRFRGRIVPLAAKGCDPDALSWTLSSFQQVDASTNFVAGCADLLKIWGVGYKPSTPPSPKRGR